MNIRKFTLALYAGIIIVAIVIVLTPFFMVQAQSCGTVGGAPVPCPTASSGVGGGGKKQKPPLALPTNTPTPTPNVFQTFTAETLTAEPTANPFLHPPAPPAFNPADATATALEFAYLQCYATIFPPAYQTAAVALTQTSNDWSSWAEATADVAVNRCAYGTPVSPTPVFIPPVAGPNSLGPGIINITVAVLIIIVCFGGGFFLIRSRFMGDGSVRADDLNPQPLPPKGMGNGSNQFAKIEDGSSQFQKADNQFIKFTKDPGSTGGSGGEQIGGSGGKQL